MAPTQRQNDPSECENDDADGGTESADPADAATGAPTDAGHSDAATQTQRNVEDESPV